MVGGAQRLRASLSGLAGGLGIAAILVLQLAMMVYYPLASDSGTGIDTGPRMEHPEAFDRAMGVPLWGVLILLGLMVLCAEGATALEIVEDLRTRSALRRARESERRSVPEVESTLLARATVRSVPGAVKLIASLAGMALVGGASCGAPAGARAVPAHAPGADARGPQSAQGAQRVLSALR